MAGPVLGADQQETLRRFRAFLAGPDHCFLLTGAAGTGKTQTVRAIVDALSADRRPVALLAPTGRAARVLSVRTGRPATTIHRRIYDFSRLEEVPQSEGGVRFFDALGREDRPFAEVFVVDEASMVGDTDTREEVLRFGSGRLLADLVRYVFGPDPSVSERKAVFVGDPAQLPPVGSSRSPALDPGYLVETFGLRPQSFKLAEVFRQERGSGVLDLVAPVRQAILAGRFNELLLGKTNEDVRVLAAGELLDRYLAARGADGSRAQLVVHTNAEALERNQAVRERLHGDSRLRVRRGDRLIVVRNHPSTGLMNGDFLTVTETLEEPVRRLVAIRGRSPVPITFRDLRVVCELLNGSRTELTVKIHDDLLATSEASLPPEQVHALYVDFKNRHPGLRPGTAEFGATLRDDPYFNALQVKYGYCITCHKAQGGEWPTVFVSFGARQSWCNEEAFRWAYTAITRARRRLWTLGAPHFRPWSRMRRPPAATADDGHAIDRLRGAVTEIVEAAGGEVLATQDLQYRLRFTVHHGGAAANVDVVHRRDGTPTAVQAQPSLPAALGAGLRLDALQVATGTATSVRADRTDADPRPSLLEALGTALTSRQVRITRRAFRPFQLRCDFADGAQRTGSLTLHFNRRGVFTSRQWHPASDPAVIDAVEEALGGTA